MQQLKWESILLLGDMTLKIWKASSQKRSEWTGRQNFLQIVTTVVRLPKICALNLQAFEKGADANNRQQKQWVVIWEYRTFSIPRRLVGLNEFYSMLVDKSTPMLNI